MWKSLRYLRLGFCYLREWGKKGLSLRCLWSKFWEKWSSQLFERGLLSLPQCSDLQEKEITDWSDSFIDSIVFSSNSSYIWSRVCGSFGHPNDFAYIHQMISKWWQQHGVLEIAGGEGDWETSTKDECKVGKRLGHLVVDKGRKYCTTTNQGVNGCVAWKGLILELDILLRFFWSPLDFFGIFGVEIRETAYFFLEQFVGCQMAGGLKLLPNGAMSFFIHSSTSKWWITLELRGFLGVINGAAANRSGSKDVNFFLGFQDNQFQRILKSNDETLDSFNENRALQLLHRKLIYRSPWKEAILRGEDHLPVVLALSVNVTKSRVKFYNGLEK